VQGYIKGLWTGFPHFFLSFLSLLLPSAVWFFVPFETLTLALFKSTQNLMNHGSIASLGCSTHESTVENYMHSPNQRRSWIFFHGFQSVLWFFLVQIFVFDEIFYGFLGLQWFIHVVNPAILHGFEKKLGFQSFSNRTLWIRTDLRWFSFTDVHAYKSGKFFDFSPGFGSEIRSWAFGILQPWFCCWFWDWNPEINRGLSFFFWTGSEPLNSSFFLLLNLPLWSVLELAAFG